MDEILDPNSVFNISDEFSLRVEFFLQVPIEEPSADLAEGKIIVDDDDLNEDSEHMNF